MSLEPAIQDAGPDAGQGIGQDLSRTSCIDSDTIVALLEDRLDADSGRSVRLHLDVCASCRQLLDASARGRSSGGAATLATDALPRGTSVGRYVILGVVGTGGMSVVYAAYDPALDRKVALKFLRLLRTHGEHAGTPEALTRRLQREAQAMARLSHPNVVGVHDIGTFAGNVFLAMEFVEGSTLAEWCGARPRSQAEVLAIFRQVGQGLAAAHRVGIVHRDFKPSNVLIGERGDVRVTDFGLARLVRDADDLLDAERGAAGARPEALELSLTQLGTAVGTPAYMAPEQFAGEPADVRSDQFSFCVALYEALYGERPFIAKTIPELSRLVQLGQIRPPPSSTVPSWLRGVLLRGLSRELGARYPSMAALLTALGRDPRRRRVRVLGGLGVLVLLGGAALAGYHVRHNEALICRGAERKLKGVWDEPQRRAIEQAFRKTGRPFALDVWTAVERSMSRHAAAFVAMHTEACEATRLRGEQSEALLDLRIGCLEQRRQELAALSSLFAAADAQIVENAPRAALSLPQLDGCRDVAQLQRRAQPPSDPATRARITELEAALARVQAQRSAGQYKPALREITPLLPEIQKLGWAPLAARALHLYALLHENTSEHAAAEQAFYQALWSAESARDDELTAQAWLDILYSAGFWQARYGQLERLRRHTDAALLRAGSPPPLVARLHQVDGMIRSEQGDQAAASKALRQALAAFEKAYGPEHPEVARTLTSLAVVCRRTAQLDEAERAFRRSLAIVERTFGPRHPNAAISRANLGGLFVDTGRTAEGIELHKSALSIYEEVYPPNDIHIAQALNGLGAALGGMGRFREAHDRFKRALGIQEKLLGPDHPRLITTLSNLAEAAQGEGALDEALEASLRVLRLIERAQGSKHPDVAEAALSIGSLYLRRGEPAPALPYFQRALGLHEPSLPEKSDAVAAALVGIGECLLLQHQPLEALPRLSRALALQEGHKPASPESPAVRTELARTRFALARALWESGREKPRALELAQRAHGELPECRAKAPPGTLAPPCDRARVDDWLKQHAPR